MLKKLSQLFLLFFVLTIILSACSDNSLDARLEAVPTSHASEPAIVADSTTQVILLTADSCLNNTAGETECKDCCDSLEIDGAGRKACRDVCQGHDFSRNTDFITIDVTSILGPDGDYSACTIAGSQGSCKDCCDASTALQSGDRRYCRDSCNQLPDKGKSNQNPPDQESGQGNVQRETVLSPVAGEYLFTEGPASDAQGKVYFSDISAGRIYKWSPDGQVSVFMEGLNGPNGLAFTQDGFLIACEGGNGRLISIDSQGQISPLAEQYNQTRFNEPNDLWIDPQGGIYFTDPAYQSPVVQDGEHVYYLTPDRSQVIRVISDLTRPNGIVGAPDGKTLYVADHGAGQTFAYKILSDGTLADKRLFASLGSDGMALDDAGNLYLTTNSTVQVVDASGKPVQEIKIPQPPTNVVFGGADGNTLFITARTAVYTSQLQETARSKPENPAKGKSKDQNAMTTEQAISDEAQLSTIAFDALAFLTGNLGADSFFPPGKVADFWGFQYLRDNDPSHMGHNTDFLTRAALNMLYVLTPAQRAELIALAEAQVDSINEFGFNRFVLMDAFRRLLEGNQPSENADLNQKAVQDYSAELYQLDGQISFERAQVMGGILSILDATQRQYLDSMAGKGMLEWPDVAEPAEMRGMSRDVKVAVMTYAGDMYSWYAGSVEADVYFAPERHGTYFGSFYLKDAPAMDNPNYTISSNLTADMGQSLLGLLTTSQAEILTSLVETQRPYLHEIVDTRRAVSTEIRRFMTGEAVDITAVLSLMGKYGELDGAIVYNFATNFARINQSLTSEQKAQLMILRQQLLGDLIYPSGAYLYSQPIEIPVIPNSDFLFAVQ